MRWESVKINHRSDRNCSWVDGSLTHCRVTFLLDAVYVPTGCVSAFIHTVFDVKRGERTDVRPRRAPEEIKTLFPVSFTSPSSYRRARTIHRKYPELLPLSKLLHWKQKEMRERGKERKTDRHLARGGGGSGLFLQVGTSEQQSTGVRRSGCGNRGTWNTVLEKEED